MSTSLKPYTSYQDTGTEWLGRVPLHWSVLPHRAVFREVIDKGHQGEEMLSVTIERGVLKQSDLLKNTSQKDSSNEDKSSYKLVNPRDIAYNKMRAWQGALGVSPHRGIVSPAYVIVRPRQPQNTSYYHHLMRTPAFKTEAERWSYGITSDQWSLRAEDFKCIQTVVPPPEEQAQIVRFIRHLDHRVNRLVKAKRRLIELLNEQKQAIIHQAVTRGLDPTVPLKPSGIEWLGDVPSHWKVMGLRLRYSVELGKMLDAKRISGEHLIPYLRNTDVQWDNVRSTNLPEMDIRPDEYERYTVRRGDLLVCEGGEVGRAAMWSQTDWVVGFQKALHRLRPRCADADNPRFLMYVLFYVAKRGVFKADGSENTIAHLTSEKLRKYRFAFPERTEQDMLVEHIDQESSDINLVIEKTQSEIDFIREYRTRLVADVVTGQLDVRHLDLPEVEESLIEAIDGDSPEDLELADEETEE